MRPIRTLQRRFPGFQHVVATSGLACLALALACGGEEASTPADAGDAGAAAKIEIPMPEAEEPIMAEIAHGELPAGYPTDLPTFPGAETKTSMVIPGGTGLVVFTTKDPVEEVAAYYAKALVEQGWSVGETSDDGMRMHAQKDSRTATVSIESADDETEIAIVLGGSGDA